MYKKKFWSKAAEFIFNIKKYIPSLTPDEQTSLSWLKLIKSVDDVPNIYQNSFEEVIGKDQFPYTILTPSYAGFSIKGSEKLVFCLKDKLYEISLVDVSPKCSFIPFEDILYIEEGRALLHSWVKICSKTNGGLPITSKFIFNTVSEHIFAPIVNRIRGNSEGRNTAVEQTKFEFLREENLKLMNYAKRSIQPDEKVVQIILQPEIQKEIIKLLGKSFYRMVSLSHISILTGRELILIQEGAGEKRGEDIRYGGVFHYIPLNKITSYETTEPNDGVFTRSICLVDCICLDSVFSVSKKQEVGEFLGQIKINS